jgi:PKD repeat protein
VVVKDQLGALVGSLIGGEWIVNTGGGSCPDASYTIEDSLGNVLYTGTIPSGGSATEVIGNSTLNVNKSDGTLISSRSILAEGTDSYNVGDSSAVLKDEDGNVLSTTPIKATETEDIVAPNGDVSVNSVAFDDVLSGGTLNIEVRKSTGNDLIGSKQGQYWRIGDSTAVIKDSANNTLKSEAIKATETENIVVNDSVAVIKNSAGTTLKSENILAEATENITINDSSVENSDATYSVGVLAEGSLILPDSQINVNGVDSGDVVSVKTIDVNLEDSLGDPVTPTSVGLVGNTLTIEVPSGSTPMDVDFSADKLTASIGENITFTDLSDQTPTHWSWRFNDGTISIVQNPVKSFSTLGFKNVSLLAGKVGAGGVNIKNNYIEIIGDADATAFLLATGITDTTIVSAINVLVTDFKNAGIWAKMKAIYPMVGGTATTHKFNLKDPRDLDAAFRLGFNGGWTHSANGALPNGSNAYADTFFNPSIDNSANSSHLSYYSRTLVTESKVEIGCYSGTNYNQIAISFGGTTYCNPNNASGDVDVNFATNSQGFFLASRTSATAIMGQRNLTQVTGLSNENRNNFKIFIGTYNNNGIPDAAGYSSKQCAFSSIGDGLSSAEATNFYNIVQAFQTTLSRQV